MILMRTLRRDYAKYAAREEEDVEAHALADAARDGADAESGWKLVHGDVFRPPRYLPVFAALLGTGVHMATLVTFVILGTIFGSLYEGRGALLSRSGMGRGMCFTRHGKSGAPFQFRPTTVPNSTSGNEMKLHMKKKTTIVPNGTAANEW